MALSRITSDGVAANAITTLGVANGADRNSIRGPIKTTLIDYFVMSAGGGGAECNPDSNPYKVGGGGGSGRVQIRYSDYYDTLASTTGSPDVLQSGDGYRVYDFKGSGSFTI